MDKLIKSVNLAGEIQMVIGSSIWMVPKGPHWPKFSHGTIHIPEVGHPEGNMILFLKFY